MGYMRHHAVVVTSYDDEAIAGAHTVALAMFSVPDKAEALTVVCHVSDVTPPAINGYRSFFIAPDGSKERWPSSEKADATRAKFIDFLRGDWRLTWAEIQFGDEDGDNRIVGASA